MLAIRPERLSISIIILFDKLNLFEIQLPKLLNNTEEILANNPIKAFYLLLRSLLLRKTSNIPPYVQFSPKIVPHAVSFKARLSFSSLLRFKEKKLFELPYFSELS